MPLPPTQEGKHLWLRFVLHSKLPKGLSEAYSLFLPNSACTHKEIAPIPNKLKQTQAYLHG